jgi:hypothetical protein
MPYDSKDIARRDSVRAARSRRGPGCQRPTNTQYMQDRQLARDVERIQGPPHRSQQWIGASLRMASRLLRAVHEYATQAGIPAAPIAEARWAVAQALDAGVASGRYPSRA